MEIEPKHHRPKQEQKQKQIIYEAKKRPNPLIQTRKCVEWGGGCHQQKENVVDRPLAPSPFPQKARI